MSARRTKKASFPPGRAVRAEIDRLVRSPEIDELIADFEAKGMHGWAKFLRLQVLDKELGPRTRAWEEKHIDPHGIWLPMLADVQRFVDQLWADLGYTDPPAVTALTTEDLEEQPRRVAYANAKEIRTAGDRAKANLDTIILHEAAHVIVKSLGICDLHGRNWFGIYLSLLERLPGRFDMAALKASAAAAGLEWAPLATASESLMAEAA